MSRTSRRTFLRGSASALGLGALASCSGGKGLPSEGGGGVLQFMANHTADDGKLLQQVIDAFHEKRPEITVKMLNVADPEQYYTKLKTAAVGHRLPDVFFARTYDTASNAAKKWQLSLEKYVQADADEVDVDDLWPAEREQMTYDGELYSLPYDFSNHAIYVNKTMLADEGVPFPTDDWTWEDLFAVAETFPRTEGNRQTRWGARFSYNTWFFMGVLKAYGGDTFSSDLRRCVVDSPENLATFRLFSRQLSSGVAPAADATPAGVDPFGAGLVAMDVRGSWETQLIRDTVRDRFEWDVVKLPKGSTGKRAVSTAGGAWGISAESENIDQAWAFLKFLTAEPQQNLLISERTRSIPGRRSASRRWTAVARSGKQPPANIDVFPDQMAEDAVDWSYPEFWSEFETVWTNRTVAIANGDDPARLLPLIQQEVNQAAERYT